MSNAAQAAVHLEGGVYPHCLNLFPGPSLPFLKSFVYVKTFSFRACPPLTYFGTSLSNYSTDMYKDNESGCFGCAGLCQLHYCFDSASTDEGLRCYNDLIYCPCSTYYCLKTIPQCKFCSDVPLQNQLRRKDVQKWYSLPVMFHACEFRGGMERKCGRR